MSKKPTYYELLKHPKWQEKRLRIMERAGFKCEWCYIEDKILHVHHTYYEKNAAPWEYPDNSLLCLCESCHERAGETDKHLRRLLGMIAASHGTEFGLFRLEGYMAAMVAELDVKEEPRACYFEVGYGPSDFTGVADFFGLTAEDVAPLYQGSGFDFHDLRELAEKKRKGDGS